jgi:hypothetical protein
LVSDDRRQNRDDHGHTCSDKPESASGHGLSTTCSEGGCTLPPQSRLLHTDLVGIGTLQIGAPMPQPPTSSLAVWLQGIDMIDAPY